MKARPIRYSRLTKRRPEEPLNRTLIEVPRCWDWLLQGLQITDFGPDGPAGHAAPPNGEAVDVHSDS
jgi:hypothetical protein